MDNSLESMETASSRRDAQLSSPSLSHVETSSSLRELAENSKPLLDKNFLSQTMLAGILASVAAGAPGMLEENSPFSLEPDRIEEQLETIVSETTHAIQSILIETPQALYEALSSDSKHSYGVEVASGTDAHYHLHAAGTTAPEIERQKMDVGLLLLGGIAAAFAVSLFLRYRRNQQGQRFTGSSGASRFSGGSSSSFNNNPYQDLGMHRGEKPNRPQERFKDIGGLDHVVEELRELRDDIEEVINGDYDIHLPRGIIMHGPPGVGKTLLARAIAGELNVPFIHFDSSQFTQMLKGTGPARVRTGFQEGRAERDDMTRNLRLADGSEKDKPNTITFPNPYGRVYDQKEVPEEGLSDADAGLRQGVCILFFDEFESIGSKRDMYEGLSDDERRNVVNSLLNEMDGLNKEKNQNIIVIAATNFLSDIDPALLRPGRFTKKIHVPLPASKAQRLDVLNKLIPIVVERKNRTIESPEAIDHLATITSGRSPDELRGVLEEAVAMSRRDKRTEINQQDLIEAYQRLFYGRLRTNYLSREKHELVAHHEHGHALAALAAGINVFLVSMEPRDQSAGRVVIDPEGFAEALATRRDMLTRILLGAGGRAAEQARYGEGGITAGASSDLDQIRGLVAHMVSNGMIDQHYTLKVDRMAQHQWPREFIDLTNTVTDQALIAAQQIVEAVGAETMEQLVTDSLSLDHELIGVEAQLFYAERLDAETMEVIAAIAARFLDNPLGINDEDQDIAV